MKIFFLFFLLILGNFSTKAQHTADYISTNAYQAQYLMQRYGLPASIILAVAIHESAAGKSKIARYLNNHFVSFLLSRKYFNVLFEKYNQYDYKNWAYGIQRGGYASSRTWANQVVAIINKYELFNYDNRPADYLDLTSEPAIERKKSSAVAVKKKIYTVKSGDNLGSIAQKTHTTVSSLMRKNGLKSSALKLGQKIKL
ncbi:MAG: LysM peptidoglycan-binding domain-containing protein [Chitinophagaceae bacterium]|nr:MAG: LysM peptidoglycan-binding domain-containing protein [Chitinophagaceae bacterium]